MMPTLPKGIELRTHFPGDGHGQCDRYGRSDKNEPMHTLPGVRYAR